MVIFWLVAETDASVPKGLTVILSLSKCVSTPISFNKASVIFMYGTEVIAPTSVISMPFTSFGAMSSSAEIYWLLTSADNVT